MRTLITGINGFVGGHLAELLLQRGWEIYGLSRRDRLTLPTLVGAVSLVQADICNAAAVEQIVAQLQPQAIVHLASQAFVPESFQDPAATLTTNILGQLNLFLALLSQQLTNCRVLVVGSSEIYGLAEPDEMPLDEQTPLRPTSPYGVSKIAQDMLALQYGQSHHLDIVRVRPFNHIGPRQNDRFVAPAFARQIARIEQGLQPPVLKVGNLSAQRDFTDVRDMAHAYLLALERGTRGAVYNIGTGQPTAIQTLLDHLVAASSVDVAVQPDPERMRPIDRPLVVCNPARFQAQTGWRPAIPLQQTLCDILDDLRARVAATETE